MERVLKDVIGEIERIAIEAEYAVRCALYGTPDKVYTTRPIVWVTAWTLTYVAYTVVVIGLIYVGLRLIGIG
jgi:hypothetical protein